MAKRQIHIDNLKIRLPREMAGDARGIAQTIGQEVIKSVAGAARGSTGSLRIDEMTAGKFRANGDIGAIGKQAANRIGAETERQIKSKRR